MHRKWGAAILKVAAVLGALALVAWLSCRQPLGTPSSRQSGLDRLQEPEVRRLVSGAPASIVARENQRLIGWAGKHSSFVKRARGGHVGLLFLGDSITTGMSFHRDLLAKCFGKYNVEAFGIPGDRTENLLWRLNEGELDGIKPQVIVVLIGTNNLAADRNQDVVLGVRAVLADVQRLQPTSKIVLLGILPRGESANDPVRLRIKQINEQLKQFADNQQIWYVDLGDRLLLKDGSLAAAVEPDFLHPSRRGFELMYEGLQPTIDRLYLSNEGRR